MLKSISFRQFLEWQAYYTLEPFGELRADLRAASIVQIVHNAAVKKEHQKALADFLLKDPDFNAQPAVKGQTLEQKEAIIWAIVNAYGATKREIP